MTAPVTRLLAFLLCLVSTPARAFLSGTMPRAASRRLVLGAAGEPSEDDELASQQKAMLRELLSASERQINFLVRSKPHVLEMRNPEEYFRSATTLFQERLGMSEHEARKIFLRMPYAPLGQSLEELGAKLDWFRSTLKLSKRNLRRLISTSPRILLRSLESSMAQIDAVQVSLQMTDKELQFLVGSPRRPVLEKILCTSIKDIKSRIDSLLTILAVDEDDTEDDEKYDLARQAIHLSPELLHTPEERVMESYNWIQQRLGIRGYQLCQMIHRGGAFLLVMKAEALEEKAGVLQSDLSLTDEELAYFVLKCPEIFKSIFDEKDKMFEIHGYHAMKKYFQDYYGFDDEEIKQFFLKHPNRMREWAHRDMGPRYDEAEAKRKKLRAIAKIISKVLAEGPNPLEKSPEVRLMPLPPEIELHYSKVEWDPKSLLMRKIHLIFKRMKELMEDDEIDDNC